MKKGDKKSFPTNYIYSTVRPYLHNMCIIDKDFMHPPIASTGFAVMACLADYCRFFLFYYLLSPCFDNYANNRENSKGVAYPAINDERLYRALIPVPPMEEQQRIVAKIEQILPYIKEYELSESRIGQLNAAFPEQLKKSILQDAVQGKLVPQDPSDEPASILLERIREEKARLVKEGKIKKDKNESFIFRRDNSYYEKSNSVERCIDSEIPFSIPDNWMWVRFSSIAIFENGDRSDKYPKDADCVDSGIPFFGAKDMGDKFMSFDSVRFISPEKFNQLGNGKLKNLDLICLLRGNVGKTRIFKQNSRYSTGFICAQMMIIRCISKDILDYLYLVLLSTYYAKTIKIGVTGTAVQQLPAKYVSRILIPIPPIEEQKRIVEQVESLNMMFSSLFTNQ